MRIKFQGKVFSFECPMCECSFEVGCKDPEISRHPTMGSDDEMIYYQCPCCGERVGTHINVTVMDGGFTRIESQEKQTP